MGSGPTIRTEVQRKMLRERVYALILLVALSVSVCLGLGLNHNNREIPDDEAMQVNASTRTTPLCTFMKQYVLYGDIRVTVCNHKHEGTILDLRKFIAGKPTIKGLVLSKNAYTSFKRFWPDINRAMERAINITVLEDNVHLADNHSP